MDSVQIFVGENRLCAFNFQAVSEIVNGGTIVSGNVTTAVSGLATFGSCTSVSGKLFFDTVGVQPGITTIQGNAYLSDGTTKLVGPGYLIVT